MNWNFRYEAYAKTHGRDPAAMIKYDAERFPGGRMAGFMIWISQKWQHFAKIRPEMNVETKNEADHHAFDAWLQEGT